MRDRLTYRYPRTLVEAFGCDAETAVAIHGPYRRPLVTDDRIAVAAVIVCLVGVGASFLLGVV